MGVSGSPSLPRKCTAQYKIVQAIEIDPIIQFFRRPRPVVIPNTFLLCGIRTRRSTRREIQVFDENYFILGLVVEQLVRDGTG